MDGGGKGGGRREGIGTSGLCVPNAALYQAELHSDGGPRLIAPTAGPRQGAGRRVKPVGPGRLYFSLSRLGGTAEFTLGPAPAWRGGAGPSFRLCRGASS